MSSPTTSLTEEQQRRAAQPQLGIDYAPTEEERRVLRECNSESLWYRSLPFSVLSMAVTQALVARGTLSVSPKFGSLPKVAFAGFFGYLVGKVSYMKTCQEKFKAMENSPVGEILRQKARMPPQYSSGPQSELSDSDSQTFDTMFQAAEPLSPMSSQTRDYGFGYNPEPHVQMGRADDFSSPIQSYVDEDESRRKPILYEDLRLKNRENYEVTLTQKTETLLKPSPPPQKEPDRPKNEVKKNIYGDTWEE
ncbi:OCIA domain-containing protein 1-like [Mugil cephalus]|uniref:OCIA domain-containing protein 1-like n=1 Tax=Mugil cephalus TaxID=48193 RepID=UPI001FB6D3FB|nr:OCIA domain-containing protein 1-like [Mugil cephalus]